MKKNKTIQVITKLFSKIKVLKSNSAQNKRELNQSLYLSTSSDDFGEIIKINPFKPRTTISNVSNENKIENYTFISHDLVLDTCRNYIENNKEKYAKLGSYFNNEIVKCMSYYLMSSEFARRQELQLNFATAKRPVESLTTQALEQEEENRFEDLLRREIELCHSGYIILKPTIILKYKQKNNIELLDDHCKEYDSLFYCENSFGSNLLYLIYSFNHKYHYYSKLQFEQNQIHICIRN